MADFQKIGELMDQILAELKTEDIPLTRNQAAVFLDVSPKTIDHYKQKGLLKQIVKYNLVGYSKADLMRIKQCHL